MTNGKHTFTPPKTQELQILTLNALGSMMEYNPNTAIGRAKIKAIKNAVERADYYASLYITEDFVIPALKKRIEYIKKADTVAEIEQILKAPSPYYDGNKYVCGAYEMDEEECIQWSILSLKTPLIDAARIRYMELFKKITGIDPEKDF